MLINPKGFPLLHFSALCDLFRKKKNEVFFKKSFFLFPVGEKWFLSLIEHERHPLGIPKLFSELFVNASWACCKNFASLSFLSHRYSADFRRSRLVCRCGGYSVVSLLPHVPPGQGVLRPVPPLAALSRRPVHPLVHPPCLPLPHDRHLLQQVTTK